VRLNLSQERNRNDGARWNVECIKGENHMGRNVTISIGALVLILVVVAIVF
jgi:hypothetical protein